MSAIAEHHFSVRNDLCEDPLQLFLSGPTQVNYGDPLRLHAFIEAASGSVDYFVAGVSSQIQTYCKSRIQIIFPLLFQYEFSGGGRGSAFSLPFTTVDTVSIDRGIFHFLGNSVYQLSVLGKINKIKWKGIANFKSENADDTFQRKCSSSKTEGWPLSTWPRPPFWQSHRLRRSRRSLRTASSQYSAATRSLWTQLERRTLTEETRCSFSGLAKWFQSRLYILLTIKKVLTMNVFRSMMACWKTVLLSCKKLFGQRQTTVLTSYLTFNFRLGGNI